MKKSFKSINFIETNTSNMKGVSYITDEKNHKKAVVIDLKTLEKYDDHIEDLFDIIITESRSDDENIPWAEVKKQLKKSGKL